MISHIIIIVVFLPFQVNKIRVFILLNEYLNF